LKWTGPNCLKAAGSCVCHPVVDPDDWFPVAQLQAAFQRLQAKLMQKIGIDLSSLFSTISSGGRFGTYRIEYPLIYANGSKWSINTGYYNFDADAVFYQYRDFVSLVRTVLLAVLFVCMVRGVLVVLRQY
jgi:hypothetical protein